MNQSVQIADIQRIAADNRLTLEAKAILLYMVTREPGYRASIPDLIALTAQASRQSRRTVVYDRLNELIAVGYVTRKLIHRGAEYTIHPVPLSPTEGDAATVTSGEGAL